MQLLVEFPRELEIIAFVQSASSALAHAVYTNTCSLVPGYSSSTGTVACVCIGRIGPPTFVIV